MFFFRCFLTALLSGILRWDSRVFGQCLTDTPLVVGVLVGLIFGDPAKGLIIGATLQLMFMGIVGIGGATPPDSMVGAVVATVFAIQSGLDTEKVVALAMPIAILGQAFGILCRVINARFNPIVDKAAIEGDEKKIENSLWAGAWIFFILTAVPVFFGCYLGAPAVQAVVDALPSWLIGGLSRSAQLLPALGMALLMQFMFNKRTAAYLFIGFVLSAYLGVSTLGITILGISFALIIYFLKKDLKGKTTLLSSAKKTVDDNDEDF